MFFVETKWSYFWIFNTFSNHKVLFLDFWDIFSFVLMVKNDVMKNIFTFPTSKNSINSCFCVDDKNVPYKIVFE